MRPTLARMAGHANTLSMDPAIIKYGQINVNRHKYFRWTPKTAWVTFIYVVAVPAVFGYIGYTTDGKYDLRGKAERRYHRRVLKTCLPSG